MVKIISGLARGMSLKTPAGQTTRPTGAKLRESVLNSLHLSLEGATFIDICAGSGAVGLEALSRGATVCYFIENDKSTLACLKENIAEFERRVKAQDLLMPQIHLLPHSIKEDFSRTVAKASVDFLWIDPPYSQITELLDASFFARLGAIAAPEAMLLLEAPKEFDQHSIGCPGVWTHLRERPMGSAKVITWRHDV